MLNYVWIALIIIGIATALGTDIHHEVANTYRNGQTLEATIAIDRRPTSLRTSWEGTLSLSNASYSSLYAAGHPGDIRQPIVVNADSLGLRSFVLTADASAPSLWQEMARPTQGALHGRIVAARWHADGAGADVELQFDPVRFVRMRAVTQAAFEYAGTAVTIALGLVGIMALWLGVMKVAEAAGILQHLARFLAPLMRRLFPDVPSDHPAISAIIMNVAANMLGLSNAATPLGLKAMEELNKLNPRAGTATNAMCTFLALNTGGLVLLPATAIAVRVATGSVNPGIIIGTSIIGAGCATIAGVVSARLLQNLPHFREEKEPHHG